MEKMERVDYESQLESYIEQNKLTDYFELLTRQLLLNKPSDPIDFLIHFLQSRKIMKFIYVTGANDAVSSRVGSKISNYINYYHVDVSKLFEQTRAVNDEQKNSDLREALRNVDSLYRGIVISGYPKNFSQTIFVQHEGILGERIYSLNFTDLQLQQFRLDLEAEGNKAGLENLSEDNVKGLRQVKECLGDYCQELDLGALTEDDAVELMKGHLKLRDHKIPPLRSPRIILITPPHLRKRGEEIFNHIQTKYGLHSSNLQNILDFHIQEKTEVGKFLQRNKLAKVPYPQDIVTALVRTELQKPIARQKGWILSGFPLDKDQCTIFKNYQLNPHLVVILDDDQDRYLENYLQIKKDPLTEIKYENDYPTTREIQDRLVPDNTSQEEWKETIEDYKLFIKEVEKVFENRYQIFRLGKETNEKIHKSVDVFINNPKIFS